MTSESQLATEENNFIQLPECQTLDSLLQSSCETSNQSEIMDNNSSVCENKITSNVDTCPKRTWSESVELYIGSLKPKDTIIFIENVKVFSKGTSYMSDFRNFYFDHILKFLNGGEPLKADFGRDEYTSLYSLFSFSSVNSEHKEECLDTPMIFKVMETMDVLDFAERNPLKRSLDMKAILKDAKDIFSYYNKIRNNHPKRKRYFIFIICSDIVIDDINELVGELRAMKVRFSLFSPVKYDSYTGLCDLLNYNGKGCKDLSCYYQSAKWPATLTHGLHKAFESTNPCQLQNKKVKWNSSKEAGESTEYDFINLMSLGNGSIVSQVSENIINHVPIDIMDNSLNNSLTGRPLPTNDQMENNFGTANMNTNNSLTTSQSSLTHSKSQPKFMTSSNTSFYPTSTLNQSQMNKVNQMPYYYNQDQLYSAPNSVSVSSHRSTPSIPHSQSPQFHMGNAHQNLLQQSNSVPEIMKPNSVESCNELHSQINSQINPQKSIQMNQDAEMVQSLQRFPFTNNMNNMYGSTNNMMGTSNMNPNRFVNRPPLYQSNIDPRNGSTNLFDGWLVYDDFRTEFRVFVDQMANLSLLSMESWDRQCFLNYVSYVDAYAVSLYGKSNTDMDLNNENGYKAPVDLQIKMTPQLIETIFNALATKPNLTIGIVRPNRSIPPDVHVQLICFILNRTTSTLKVLIPADPKNLLNEIKNRIPSMHPGNQTNQMYTQMKRNNIVPNQQLYNIPQTMAIPRQMMNRYSSHNSAPMSMINNQVYRSLSHPPNFINNQQMLTSPNYILHSGQYQSVQNQSSNHMISMDMGIQPSQNMYDQNGYGIN